MWWEVQAIPDLDPAKSYGFEDVRILDDGDPSSVILVDPVEYMIRKDPCGPIDPSIVW